MKKQEAFKIWKERIGLKIPDLKEMFNDIELRIRKTIHEMDGTTRTEDDPQVERETLSAMKLKLGSKYGSLKSPAPTHRAYILGDTKLVDFYELMTLKAKSAYRRDPEGAVAKELVDMYGTPLMTYTEEFGPNRKQKGDPIEGHSYQREFYVIGNWDLDSKKKKFSAVTFRGTQAANLKVDTPKITRLSCDFRANVTKEGTINRITASDAAETHFRQVAGLKPIPFDMLEKDIEATIGFTDILDLETEFRRLPTKERKRMVVAIRARVIKSIAPEAEDDVRNNYMVTVTDDSLDFDLEEMPLQVYVPEEWYCGWDTNSRVILIGRPRIRIFNEREIMVMDVYGIHLDEFSVIPLEDEEDKPKEGWIPSTLEE